MEATVQVWARSGAELACGLQGLSLCLPARSLGADVGFEGGPNDKTDPALGTRLPGRQTGDWCRELVVMARQNEREQG